MSNRLGVIMVERNTELWFRTQENKELKVFKAIRTVTQLCIHVVSKDSDEVVIRSTKSGQEWNITHALRAKEPAVNINAMPVSRFQCVSGLSVYWPIIALGTHECGVAKLCRDPTVQSEFFLRVSLLKTFN